MTNSVRAAVVTLGLIGVLTGLYFAVSPYERCMRLAKGALTGGITDLSVPIEIRLMERCSDVTSW
jgi:hypothetical protein